MEELVFQALREKLAGFRAASGHLEPDKKDAIARKNLAITGKDREIAALLEKIPEASPTVMGYINRRVSQLEAEKDGLTLELTALLSAEGRTPSAEVPDYLDRWEALSVQEKRSVVDCVVDVIHGTQEKITILWKL